jgi:hypothetical protein
MERRPGYSLVYLKPFAANKIAIDRYPSILTPDDVGCQKYHTPVHIELKKKAENAGGSHFYE